MKIINKNFSSKDINESLKIYNFYIKNSISNFEEKEICRIQKTLHTETIEKVSGYRLTIEIDGELISINSNRSYRPGEIISIRKEVNYSIY